MKTSHKRSVIIIGAGLSGLRAAQLFHKAGFKITVLEAQNRVGGRLCPGKLSDGEKVDLGGQWIGKSQTAILTLLKELDIDVYESYNQGLKAHWRKKSGTKTFSGTGTMPSMNIFALLDTRINAISAINKLTKGIDISQPHKSENAAYLDSITVKSWAKSKLWTNKAKELLDVAVRMIFGAESGEISMLCFLVRVKSAGGFMNLTETRGGAQEYKVKGGAYNIPLVLKEMLPDECIHLNHPVTMIRHDKDRAEVHCGKRLFVGDYVVLAIPPPEQTKITFEPSLGFSRNRLCEKAFMAAYIKIFIIYKTAWWRERGYNGEAISFDDSLNASGDELSPISMVFDGCNEDLSVKALTIFIVGKHAIEHTQIPPERARDRILEHLVKIFKDDAALKPTEYIEKNWLLQDWVEGAPAAVFPPGTLNYYGHSLREPIGRVYFAGAETAHQDMGSMSGAVQAAERVVFDVLRREGVEI